MCYRLRTTHPCAVCAGHKLNVFQLANIVCATCPNNENRSEHRKPKDTVSLSLSLSPAFLLTHTIHSRVCPSRSSLGQRISSFTRLAIPSKDWTSLGLTALNYDKHALKSTQLPKNGDRGGVEKGEGEEYKS